MNKRRGSILPTSLLVMFLLVIVGGAVFSVTHANRRSSEQHYGLSKARSAADSLLYSTAIAISEDITSLGLVKGVPLQAVLNDGLISADLWVTTSDDVLFSLSCFASYGKWESGKKSLTLVKRVLPKGGIQWDWHWN